MKNHKFGKKLVKIFDTFGKLQKQEGMYESKIAEYVKNPLMEVLNETDTEIHFCVHTNKEW